MKLFYTRKEHEEEMNREIGRIVLEKEREREFMNRLSALEDDICHLQEKNKNLQERIKKLELQSLELKRFQGSGGIGGQGTLRPEFCNCNAEERR